MTAAIEPGDQVGRKQDCSQGGVAGLPHGRAISVRAPDGARLHTEIFGPDDGYPIVLCHGITCALRVWRHQIADLSADHRVIAFDHRGHGHSSVPRRSGYTLDHLAADLHAVLDATLNRGERAVIAGHSMGAIAIMAWADRHRNHVRRRADAVALINTTTGDLLQELHFLQVPSLLAATRIRVAQELIETVGSLPLPRGVQWTSRRFIAAMAVGVGADPEIGEFLFDMFAATSPAGRGGCAKMLIDALGPEHISLEGLTVPTLVVGGEKDRLLPIGQSRRIADKAPNLAALVELPGGHCAILEHPDQVNRHLRELVTTVTTPRRASFLAGQQGRHVRGRPPTRADRAVKKAGPLIGGLGAGPVNRSDGLA